MNSKCKGKSSATKLKQSAPENDISSGSKKFQSVLHEFTTIKRPQSKNNKIQSSAMTDSRDNPTISCANTIPRVKKSDVNQSIALSFMPSYSESKRDLVKINSDTSSYRYISQESVELLEKVAEFGEKLKHKRSLMGIKDAMKNTLILDDIKGTVNSVDKTIQSLSRNTSSEDDEIIVSKVEEDASSIDDFGLNNFNENVDHNYIIEPYNQQGQELFHTFSEIKSRSMRLNSSNEQILEQFRNEVTMLVHQNEDTNEIQVLKDIEMPRNPVDFNENFVSSIISETSSGINDIDLNSIDKAIQSLSHNTSSEDDVIIDSKVKEDASIIDDFGLNIFNENVEHNYIIEAYNQQGQELVYTFWEIKRLNSSNEQILEEFRNGDTMLVHQNEDTNEIQVLKDIEMPRNPVDFNESLVSSIISETSSGINDIDLNSANSEESGIDLCSPRTTMYLEEPPENTPKFYKVETSIYDHNEGEKLSQYEIFDDEGNVRISRFSSTFNLPNFIEENPPKLAHIVDEFIKTEEYYLDGLRKVINEYKPFLEKNCPVHLLGKTSYLFGNIDRIYEKASNFFKLLKGNANPDGIANAIIGSASMFELYPKYSQNKPTADLYMKEFELIIKRRQKQLGDKLDLASYLLTPIQRLGKYILMLENIRKELDKRDKSTERIITALEIVRNSMRNGNDSIAIDSIKNCPVDLTQQGSLIMRETFHILKPKKFEAMVFLFEKIVVFTHARLKAPEQFLYHKHIMMNDLSIASFENDPAIFHLSDYSKNKKVSGDKYTFVLESKSNKVKLQWTACIEKRLWDQLEEVRVKQYKLNNQVGKSNSTAELPKKYRKYRKSNNNQRKTKSLTRSGSIFYDHVSHNTDA